MKNHSWVTEEIVEYGTKPHKCKTCGISKQWCGGDYQCWEYIWYTQGIAVNGELICSRKTSFKRPDCNRINFAEED